MYPSIVIFARIQRFQHVNGSNNDIFNIFIQIQTILLPSNIVHIKMQLFDQFTLYQCKRVMRRYSIVQFAGWLPRDT